MRTVGQAESHAVGAGQAGTSHNFGGYCHAVRFPGMHTNTKTIKKIPAVFVKNKRYLVAVKLFLRPLYSEYR